MKETLTDPQPSQLGKTYLVKYQCPVCKSLYDTSVEATACFNTTEKAEFQVGDLVTMYPRYGWYDGDKDWVLSTVSEEHDKGRNRYEFLYVVLRVGSNLRYPHETNYWVRTLACGQKYGWTGRNHYRLSRLTDDRLSQLPDHVIKAAAGLAAKGWTDDRLDIML